MSTNTQPLSSSKNNDLPSQSSSTSTPQSEAQAPTRQEVLKPISSNSSSLQPAQQPRPKTPTHQQKRKRPSNPWSPKNMNTLKDRMLALFAERDAKRLKQAEAEQAAKQAADERDLKINSTLFSSPNPSVSALREARDLLLDLSTQIRASNDEAMHREARVRDREARLAKKEEEYKERELVLKRHEPLMREREAALAQREAALGSKMDVQPKYVYSSYDRDETALGRLKRDLTNAAVFCNDMMRGRCEWWFDQSEMCLSRLHWHLEYLGVEEKEWKRSSKTGGND